MAKQKRIEGTFDPTPADVQEAVDKWLGAKRRMATLRRTLNEWKNTLIERMKEHDLEECEIDDGDKILRLEEDSKLRVESVKKGRDEDADQDDDD